MDFLQLRKNLKNDFTGLPVQKIAVLADSASQLLCQALKGYGYSRGIHLDIWEADYDQIYQTVLDENSKLYTTRPDFVIVFQFLAPQLSHHQALMGQYTGQKADARRKRVRLSENWRRILEGS